MDGELSGHEETMFAKHLKMCNICQKELEILRFSDNAILNIPEIEPSTGFDRAFWDKIDTIEAKKSRWAIPFDILFGKVRPQLLAACSVIVVAGAVFFMTRPYAPGEDDILIAENLELLQDYEVIDNLDLLENWETIMNKKENT